MKEYRYGTIDPFLQVDNADKILNEIFQVTSELKMKTFLLWGLCLGFVRDEGYIKGDNDLDIGVICPERERRRMLTAALKEKGYVYGNPHRFNNVHFRKNRVLVDVFFLKSEGFYLQFDSVEYKGRIYPVPRPVEKFLSASYSSWRVKERQTARYVSPSDDDSPRDIMNQEEFWKIRSKKFNDLNWANDISYINMFIHSGDFEESDRVLDVGTGTGIIAHAIAPLVKEVIGIDISQDMLDHSNWNHNTHFIKRDIRNLIFHRNVFDKVTARMVFHHIIERTQGAMDECHRVLKKGGKMILAEGVPPIPEVEKEYTNIFKLKEERLTFTEDRLMNMMMKSRFKNIEVLRYIMKDFSVNDWLGNSGLIKDKQDEIFELHVEASDLFKKAYNMRITKEDCFIDIKNLILVGEK